MKRIGAGMSAETLTLLNTWREVVLLWDAIKVPGLAQFPADIEAMTGLDDQGRPVEA